MNINISDSWKSILEEEFEKEYFQSLLDFVGNEYDSHTCYPEVNEIFTAFNHCPYEKVKVIIIGQDPYHGNGQAMGFVFQFMPELNIRHH